jgi:PAS domain S-box-containing protein
MTTPTIGSSLRNRAERKLCSIGIALSDIPSNADDKKLLQELQVHQIELEMQNEELCQEQEQSEIARNMYAELYDLAPIAYFTFDSSGVIQEVNNACAHLLETKMGELVNKHFDSFIADADERKIFANHLAMVLLRKVVLKCTVKLTRNDGIAIHAQLQSVAVTSLNRDGFILTSVIDGTIRKQFEEDLKASHDHLEKLVQERTRELTLDIEQRKKAEESLKTKNAEIECLKNRLQTENVYLHQEVDRLYNFGDVIGKSDALLRIFAQVEQAAPMNVTVLLLGETGTGKGVIARAIHNRSTRKGRPLITVDCATLPAALVESELFGRERGAFTGSDSKQIGRFELADGGTIFLDEIGEMPLALQSKLLRVIQDGEFERLGNPRTIKTDVRIIAASNRDLAAEVKNGTFREDLFYRINVFPIMMPPLRQRKGDIQLLVNHFITKYNKKSGKHIETLSKEALHTLQEYQWPGNVRELESVIERAVIISRGVAIQVLDSFEMTMKPEAPVSEGAHDLGEMERDHIMQILLKTGWRIEGSNGAAVLLGLNASTLRARMRKHGLVRK